MAEKTAHLCWLHDHRFDGQDLTRDFGDSDHIYFIVDPSRWGLDRRNIRSYSILLPGARDDVRAPEGIEARRDFCLAGFLPAPLDGNSHVSFMPNGKPVSLTKFLRAMPASALRQSHKSLPEVRTAIDETCKKIGCHPIVDERVVQVFDEILPRTIERSQIVESIIGLGGSLDIFGPCTWRSWPQFAQFHRSFVEDPCDLDIIFQSTRVNIHSGGIPMHPRVVDCLAAGGFLLATETSLDFAEGGIRHHLEPGRHYVSYTADDIAAVAKNYLADERARKMIAAEGRREILASHTWTHRAAQVLYDLNLPALSTPHVRSEAIQSSRRLQAVLDLA